MHLTRLMSTFKLSTSKSARLPFRTEEIRVHNFVSKNKFKKTVITITFLDAVLLFFTKLKEIN